MKLSISVAAAVKIFKKIEESCSPECRDPPEANKPSKGGQVFAGFRQVTGNALAVLGSFFFLLILVKADCVLNTAINMW